MRRGRHCILAMAVAIVSMLASCRQELCYDHYPTLDMRFDWEQEWERDYGQYHRLGWDAEYFGSQYEEMHPGFPEWVNMIRYIDGQSPEEHFVKPEGDSYIVEAGKESSILMYNGDTEYVVVLDVASLNQARAIATARSRAGAAMQMLYDAHQGARTTNPPDALFSAYLDYVPGIYNHELRRYNVKMQPLVYTYVIMYEFEYGLHNVALARGAIGGMAEAVYLRTGVTSEETAIILFDCDITDKGCTAKVRSFGAPGFPDIYYGRNETDGIDRKYTLTLELKLKNGQNVDYTYDISDQLKNQPRGGVIKIPAIRVEDPPEDVGSGGFDVDVSGWDDSGEVIDLPIGNQTN